MCVFVLSLFRVYLVLLDWKVKVETTVLRCVWSDDPVNVNRIPGYQSFVTKWCSCVCTGTPWHPRACRTTWQSWQEGEWTQWPGQLSLLCVCVCMCVLTCLCVCCCVFVLVVSAQTLRGLLSLQQTIAWYALKGLRCLQSSDQCPGSKSVWKCPNGKSGCGCGTQLVSRCSLLVIGY